MTVALGIDTGGTYTDAVLVDHGHGEVLAAAKALTTRHDLSIGISEAIAAVFAGGQRLPKSGRLGKSSLPEDVDLVALSTTFATNAIAEGQGSPVCLLLIGYDRELMQQYGFQQELVTDDVVYLRGGHDVLGDEAAPLDEEAARQAILARRGKVEAFAVSGYFGVRNPTHELRVRALVEELTAPGGGQAQGGQPQGGQPQGLPLPVTCGHELTTRLNAVRRATTVALNARLIPLLRELIASVQRTLYERGIAAPLMVVKGDGSLVRAAWAMQRPIETILSGPAASAVGAWHLAGRGDVWVVDVGGTTTDIAALRDGQPRLNPEGARVGGWRTMVEAVDVHTTGLGGDSHVRGDGHGRLRIGPRRVVPLCLLASEHPEVVDELRRQAATQEKSDEIAQFLLLWRRPRNWLSDEDRALLHRLEPGPQSLPQLLGETRYGWLQRRRIEKLEAQLVLQRAGFTPTDALHVLGRFQQWDAQASRLGAELLAAQMDLPVETFCEQVVRGVSDRVATELVSKVLEDEVGAPDWEREPSAAALLARALSNPGAGDLACDLTLRRPLVAIGAPVAAYMPRVAERLHTELIIPPHAGVANAVGAVAGGVVQRLRVLINPLDGAEHFRLHLPDGVHDFGDLEEAVQYAQQVMSPHAEALARQAGAEQAEVQMARTDRRAKVGGGWGEEIYLGTELIFTAVGRPSPARTPTLPSPYQREG
ncbi:MAG: hydantoinase/oxoprolinase family protein [Chloroflexi bacterium]|nr:hydantoinase/oxoprolinase family protein [Chloroflexota bacterium]